MISTLIDGKKLQGVELKKKLEELYQEKKFKKLVERMQDLKEFNLKSLIPKKAYVFDATVSDEKSLKLINSTIIHLVDEEQNISILYNELPSFKDHYYGQILNKEDTNTLYGYEFDDKNEIIITRNETEVTMLNFQDETELPNNPNYEPKQRFTSNDFVAPMDSWTDGCLPGGYQHCGGNCGYNMKYGGGKPINDTDVCCVAHDECWRVYGNWDACCDKEIVSCVKGHTTVAAVGIRAFFGPLGLLCK